MVWENPANINWSDGFTSFLAYINSVSLGWVSRLLLIGVYVIVVTGYYKIRDDITGALAAAGTATFIVALMGFLLHPPFVDWITFAISIGVLFVGAAAAIIDRNTGTA